MVLIEFLSHYFHFADLEHRQPKMTAKLSDKSNIMPTPNTDTGSRTSPSVQKPNRSKNSSSSGNIKKKRSAKSSKKFIQSHLVNAKETERRDTSPNKESTSTATSRQDTVRKEKRASVNIKQKQKQTDGLLVIADPVESKSNKPQKKPIASNITTHHNDSGMNPNQNRSTPTEKVPPSMATTSSSNANEAFDASVQNNREDASDSNRTNRSPEPSSVSPSASVPSSSNQRNRRPYHTNRGIKYKNNRRSNSYGNRRKKKDKLGKTSVVSIDADGVVQKRDVDADDAFSEGVHSECERTEHSPSPTCVPEEQEAEVQKNLHHPDYSKKEITNDSTGDLATKTNEASQGETEIETLAASDNDAETIPDKHVKTNAAGLALLNRLSARSLDPNGEGTPPPTPTSIDDEGIEDGVNSLEVNQSSTESSDLVEEMARIDLSLDQGQEYCDDSSSMTGMIPPPAVAWHASAQGMNGCLSPDQQQPQQPWAMTMPPPPYANDSQDYYNYVQEPMFIAMTPYGQEYIMPQAPYPMVYNSFQNVPGNEYPQMPPPSGPLKYEQVSIGGTVFFNPVYGEDKDMATDDTIDGDSKTSDEVVEKEHNQVQAKKGKKKGKRGKKGKASKKMHARGKDENGNE